MLKRFGTWMYRYRRGLAMAVLVAGLFVLLLLANGGANGSRWPSGRAKPKRAARSRCM
jgi:hypothetical protein